MIIVECYKDKALVHRIGFPGYQVRHAYNKPSVLWRLEQDLKAIGIIDEDPFAGRSKYLKEYYERDSIGNIKLLIRKDDDGERIIRVAPDLSACLPSSQAGLRHRQMDWQIHRVMAWICQSKPSSMKYHLNQYK